MLNRHIRLRCKTFATNIIDKEKKLSQFFKLPKHDLPQEVYDTEAHGFPDFKNEEFDKKDIIEKVTKKRQLESQSKFNKFFDNVSTSGESIKITENLIQKLRLKKEFKFNEDFKQK
jgi:hypothetical protein